MAAAHLPGPSDATKHTHCPQRHWWWHVVWHSPDSAPAGKGYLSFWPSWQQTLDSAVRTLLIYYPPAVTRAQLFICSVCRLSPMQRHLQGKEAKAPSHCSQTWGALSTHWGTFSSPFSPENHLWQAGSNSVLPSTTPEGSWQQKQWIICWTLTRDSESVDSAVLDAALWAVRSRTRGTTPGMWSGKGLLPNIKIHFYTHSWQGSKSLNVKRST